LAMNRAGAGVLPMEIVGLKNQPDSETSALVELSKVDLENRRVNATSRIATAMLASTCLLLVLVLGLIITVAVMLNRLNDSIAEIANAVGPSTVSSAIATIQSSLYNVQGAHEDSLQPRAPCARRAHNPRQPRASCLVHRAPLVSRNHGQLFGNVRGCDCHGH
jgi:hypothetical protein